MRVNQDDMTGSGKLTAPCSIRTTLTCRCPAIGGHVGSGGMRQERSVSGFESRGWGGTLASPGTTRPRPRGSFFRTRTGIA